MIVTAHQPAYLPWLGYLEKIIQSDVYVYMDSVQFEERSFINRNRIKTARGPQWLTIPVKSKGHREQTMMTLEIDNGTNWRKEHLKTIFYNYKKAPYFDERYPKLEQLYAQEYGLLVDLCWDHLQFWLQEIGVEKKIVKLSSLPTSNKKSGLILDICMQLQATSYISGALGKGYLEEEAFESADIKIIFQDFIPPVYKQLWGEFVPNLSIIDYWMNNQDFDLLVKEGNHGLINGLLN